MSRRLLTKPIYPHTKRAITAKPSRFNIARYGVGVYLDNAAATPIDKEVIKEMLRGMELYGNPSSFNDLGRIARDEMEKARTAIARSIGAHPEEIIFTSSGSEANNLAIFGFAGNYEKPQEIITTSIEHMSVLESFKVLERGGWMITKLKVDHYGFINLEYLTKAINPEIVFLSIIYANNEIGTIQPINRISKILKEYRKKNNTIFPLLHIDACQAAGYLNINVNALGVDLMTFNGAKIYGPRGVGVLYVRKNVILKPLIVGGNQEKGLRAGTENLPGILGIAKALSLISIKKNGDIARLRNYFINNLIKMPSIVLNGPSCAKVSEGRPDSQRLANNINISIEGLDSENLLLELDKYNIRASSGSACTSHSVEPSHVLKAIGVDRKYLNGALRFSLGRQTTKKEIDHVLKVLPEVIKNLKKRYKKLN